VEEHAWNIWIRLNSATSAKVGTRTPHLDIPRVFWRSSMLNCPFRLHVCERMGSGFSGENGHGHVIYSFCIDASCFAAIMWGNWALRRRPVWSRLSSFMCFEQQEPKYSVASRQAMNSSCLYIHVGPYRLVGVCSPPGGEISDRNNDRNMSCFLCDSWAFCFALMGDISTVLRDVR